MTIEHAPSTNGRVASGEAYDEPQVYRQKPRLRRRRFAIAGLITPLLLALAAFVVARGLSQSPDD